MPSQILILGCDKGAWQMRGKQLGAAMRVQYSSHPVPHDFAAATLLVLVKRAAQVWYAEAKAAAAHARIVWDVLDYWKQPQDNTRPIADLIQDVALYRRAFGWAHVIGATQAMADDLGGTYLPHHSRLGLTPAPIRKRIQVVAYEGSPRYLGRWRAGLEQACDRLGVAFVINPDTLTDADIVVAFRDEPWDGAVCRRWKSGVKYVNAMAAGRPVITQACAAFDELQPPGICIGRMGELADAIQSFVRADIRQWVLERCAARAPEFAVDTVVARYRRVLEAA